MPGMQGMGSALRTNDPTIVSAFHTALVHQGIVVLMILAALAAGWYLLGPARTRPAPRTSLASGAEAGPGGGTLSGTLALEPDARRLLRIGFGLLWVLDGILQAQASMPLGMVPRVISPTAGSSPSWVQHLVNSMATTWTYHPIAAAAAAVWIQLGIGIWLLVAPRGNVSRLAGLASLGWGLVVWIFGESFGGIFAPGLTWLMGAPGAALIYCFAGLLIALPERNWRSARLGRTILAVIGLFFVGMAVLQAWPGRGFWQGRIGHSSNLGSLASLVQDMSQTSQPHWLASLVTSFLGFDTAHGWAVNLFVVMALGLIGVAFLIARPPVIRVAVVAAVLLCLADWVLVEDLGFFGGVGTDPNSMIPLVLVFVAGFLALPPALAPATSETLSTVPAAVRGIAVEGAGGSTAQPALSWRAGSAAAGAASLWRSLGRWSGRLDTEPSYAFRWFAAVGAVGVTLIGVAPMTAAAANPNADPILARAANGPPETTNIPTPAFSLVDQYGERVSLTSLHGKIVALIFLDPGCAYDRMSGCAAAQELRLVDRVLGTGANRVELVAIDSNPLYLSPDDLVSFDGQAGLNKVGNWLYLTGPRTELNNVLNNFGVHAADPALELGKPGGYMMGLPHGQSAYVIDPSGRTREVVSIGDRGSVPTAMESSVAVTLANAVKQVANSHVDPPG